MLSLQKTKRSRFIVYLLVTLLCVSNVSTDIFWYYSWTIDKLKYYVYNFQNSTVKHTATMIFFLTTIFNLRTPLCNILKCIKSFIVQIPN